MKREKGIKWIKGKRKISITKPLWRKPKNIGDKVNRSGKNQIKMRIFGLEMDLMREILAMTMNGW